MGHLHSSFTNLEGIPVQGDAFVVIVNTEWNNDITDELTNGCVKLLEAAGVRHEIITVPGAVELVSAVTNIVQSQAVKAVIAFGCVIQGGTPHFEYVCNLVTQGIATLNAMQTTPVIFGVLTVNTKEQALERIGGIEGHKGEEAAVAAIKMMNIQNAIRNNLGS